jgi:hypothetical protein
VQADNGGQVNLNGGSVKTPNTVTTIADGSIGLYAASAGVINVNGVTKISTGATGETPSGASAYGVNADGLNSKVNLNAATTVTTNGTGAFGTTAYGLYASNGGTIDGSLAPSVGVTTYGDGAIGVYASGTAPSPSTTPSTITIGGVATIVTNGGVATIDVDDTEVMVPAAGVQADNGGQVTLSGGGTVTTNGADAPGVVATGAGSTVTLNGTSLLTVTTITDDSVGLQAASGGVIDSTGPLTISTGSTGETPSGAMAYGVEATGANSKVTLSGATTVTTKGVGASGLDAYGLYANGGGTIDGSLAPSVGVTTYGTGAIGVYASGSAEVSDTVTPSTISIANATVVTHGDAAVGVLADEGGQVTVAGGSVNTFGGAPDAGAAIGVEANGVGSKVTLTGAITVATNATGDDGSGAYGLYAVGGATIDGSTATSVGVTTYGTGAVGVYASGSGTVSDTVTASTIIITGATVVTNGASATGVLADGGALATVNGGSVTTNGATAIGVEANGVASEVDLKGAITVATGTSAAAGAAYGLYAVNGGTIDGSTATSVGVTTSGTGAIGVYASGSGTISDIVTASTITIVGAKVITNGASATGVLADGGALATVNGGSVTANGATAIGVEANGTLSEVDLKGAITVATGTSAAAGAAYGLYAVNGGTIDGSTATSVGVTTSGTGAIGVYAHGTDESDTASTISIAGAVIVTNGGSATGVLADLGGFATVTGGSVTTHGLDSPGVVATGMDSRADLAGTTSVSTTNNGGIGLYATLGGVVTATGSTTVTTTGTTSTTTGLGSYGVNADGTGSHVNLAAATITTSGVGATGLYASDINATGQGGAITVSGALGVTTGSGTGSAANGAWAQSAGSTIALNGASTFTIGGDAYGLLASGGGVITATGTLGVTVNGDGADAGGVQASGANSSATLSGATTITLNGSQNTGLFATTGGSIETEATTSVNVNGASSTGVQATSATVTATGTLNVTTSQASSVAFALAGAAPSIVASGGGTVSAAGNAINFIGATGAVATFDNFNITSSSGDLIFADPSTATINFNNTTATANGGNLLNATNQSVIAFNANASTLTGAIQTDATSKTNVSLTNGTNWTMTGSSTMTSLNLSNSSVTFSPSGGFKTLTVGSLVGGSGANVTLNTQLAGSQTDQIVINGGTATGTTLLTIKNASANNAGAATALPVVVTTNGGTTTTTAFKLASPVTAGGFQYTLAENPSNDDWFLTGSPLPTPENAITAASIQNSVNSLAQAQFNNMVTTRLLGSLLLGANEQVSGCDCGGGSAGVGSFSLGSHGRWALSDTLTLLAGTSWNSFYQDGTNVSASPIVAASLRYDPSNWGTSRPFVEFGAFLSPYTTASYTRYYNNGFTPAVGTGSAIDRGLAVFGRVGWVARLTPIDEGAVFVDLVRAWQEQGGYTEVSTAVNPFPATLSNGVDRGDVVRVGAQYTHLLWGNVEANINGAVAYGFDSKFGSQVAVVDFGSIAPFPLLNSTWVEYGGRLAYRFSRSLVVDAFALGTLGGDVGRTLHVGLGARYAF